MSRELGGALGIAVLGSVMNAVYRADVARSTDGLAPSVAAHAKASLAGAQQIAGQLGAQGHRLASHAEAAFVNGLTRSLLAGAVVLLFGAAFVALRAQGSAESTANAGVGAPAEAV